MWKAVRRGLPDRKGVRFAITRGAQVLSFADAITGWRTDAEFRKWFNVLLAEVPFEAFRWETPAVTTAAQSRPVEFVVLDSPGLARTPDLEAFREHFARANDDVVAFANLGGDAILVAPRPIADAACYGHLASFVREAPENQRNALWRLVGETMANRISGKPVWLSTAGAGVSWLHVRLDDRPKYYGFAPYRQLTDVPT